MDLTTLFGLPTHPLIVHATVVAVPAAAVAVVVSAVWPAGARRVGLVTPLLAALAVILVPLTSQTGENLQARLPDTALVERHAELAEGLLPWVVALLVVALALEYVRRRPVGGTGEGAVAGARRARGSSAIATLLAVLAVIGAAGTTVQVVRIGHSGAQAAWNGVPSNPLPGRHEG